MGYDIRIARVPEQVWERGDDLLDPHRAVLDLPSKGLHRLTRPGPRRRPRRAEPRLVRVIEVQGLEIPGGIGDLRVTHVRIGGLGLAPAGDSSRGRPCHSE